MWGQAIVIAAAKKDAGAVVGALADDHPATPVADDRSRAVAGRFQPTDRALQLLDQTPDRIEVVGGGVVDWGTAGMGTREKKAQAATSEGSRGEPERSGPFADGMGLIIK